MLKVQASAGWSGPPGACDDGLGQNDPVQNSYAGPTLVGQKQSGTGYVVADASSGHVTYQITPTSSATSGTCSVSVSVALSPVVLSVGGVTLDASSNASILVGQGATGSLTCGIGTFSGWQWSVGGSKFASWTVSNDQSTATLAYVPDSAWTTASPHWYWSTDQNGVTVSCTATLTTPDGAAHSVSGSERLDVWPPDYTFNGTPSPKSSYLYDGTDVVGVQANDTVSGDPGMAFAGAVGTPTEFSGDGYWQYVQIAAPVQRITDENGNTTSVFPANTIGLDNDWPYPIFTGAGPPWNAGESGGVPYGHATEDSPDQEFPVTTQGYEMEDEFEMYEMYRPPGSDTQWVPVSDIQWGWSDQQNRGSGNWPGPTAHAVIDSPSVRQTLHPTWTQVLTNG